MRPWVADPIFAACNMKRPIWSLPDGVEDLLPPQAWELERIRRKVLDLFRDRGFDYIEPPLVEYLDALLVAGGQDLDLQTLKMVDQRSGRLLGVRADLTSQAARIDASHLNADGVTKLCYAGPVVHANPRGVLESRVPIKAGAEIFGSRDLEADAEVIALMIETLGAAGAETAQAPKPLVVLGNMGVYRALTRPLALQESDEETLFSAVQSKSENDIRALAGGGPLADLLVALPRLMGRIEDFDGACLELKRAPAEAGDELARLGRLVELVQGRCKDADLRFDLAELAGFGYHNGPVFAAFHGGRGQALARGGRYDGIGAAFGRSRPATGFDLNLKRLLNSLPSRPNSEAG